MYSAFKPKSVNYLFLNAHLNCPKIWMGLQSVHKEWVHDFCSVLEQWFFVIMLCTEAEKQWPFIEKEGFMPICGLLEESTKDCFVWCTVVRPVCFVRMEKCMNHADAFYVHCSSFRSCWWMKQKIACHNNLKADINTITLYLCIVLA